MSSSSLLSGCVQPPLMTLLSSTTKPLSPLFTFHTDPSLPSDSVIKTLDDTVSRLSTPHRHHGQPTLVPKHPIKGPIAHPVIHIQSPNIAKTYIQTGISLTDHREHMAKGRYRGVRPLGAEIPWVGFHLRPLGQRSMTLEIGVVDGRGREGVVRCSTFKHEPSVHPYRSPPLIHLPLSIPTSTSSTLSPWLHISFDVSTLIPMFSTLPRPRPPTPDSDDDTNDSPPPKRRKVEVPSGRFGSISYVRVYANCRIRRIWFADNGEQTLDNMDRGGKDEWSLYAYPTDA